MIVYQKNKSEFLDDAFKRDIEVVILSEFKSRTGKAVSAAEIRAWKESLLSVAKVLNDGEIPGDSGVAIEYNIPQTGKRIDFMLSGKNEVQQDNLIIIELKQWSAAKKTNKDAIVAVRFSGGEIEVSHPSYQAWSYKSLLENFNEEIFQGNIQLFPCAYLHNYELDSVLTDNFYKDHIDRAPVFLKGDIEKLKLQEFIKKYVKHGDQGALIYRIEGARIRPSKGLVDSLIGLITGNEEFVLIDDQKVIYENALEIARTASEQSKKVLIVEGGPGTGKSVVAINLLVALSKMDLVSKYVTKNAAPRAVFESKLTGTIKKTAISNLFTGSGGFTQANKNDFDALIIDEAHRLNEKSGLYGNLGDNQIKELIRAAKFSIFFLDEDQRVTFKDIGSKGEIIRWAKSLGATVKQLELSSQFRCNGSDGYLAWLDNTLQIRTTQNEILAAEEFDFRVIDSPQTLRELIVEKNKLSNKARMVAGYCWDWVSKKRPKESDVVLPAFGFSMQWNLTKDGGLWIMADDSINQIGCIHTCQGLEVDYIGVIVGPDIIVRDGQVVTCPEKRSRNDKSLSGYKKLLKSNKKEASERADSIIRNTYRTLMTRGMKGCYVYFTDKEAADFFRSRLAKSVAKIADAAPLMKNELPNKDVGNIVLPFERLEPHVIEPYVNSVPLVDLKFAAGTFSDVQVLDSSEAVWVSLPDVFRLQPGLFVAQVIGESMNRRIPNKAWCLFKSSPTGTRQGKVVVAQHRSIHDPDLGGSYTIKVYQSEKKAVADGEWTHARVTLKPDSTDPSYAALEFGPDTVGDLSIVAELIAVL